MAFRLWADTCKVELSTIAELLVGAMLGGGGHVTRALLAVTPRRGWQAYHWMLERGRFRLLGLVAALCGIVRRETRGPRRFAVVDDTLAPRCSAKAPGAAVRFGHARKPNRPAFLLCQAFVTAADAVLRDRQLRKRLRVELGAIQPRAPTPSGCTRRR